MLDKDGEPDGRPGPGAHQVPDVVRRPGADADHAGGQASRGRPRLVRLPRHGPRRPRAERAALRVRGGPGHQDRPQAGQGLVGLRPGRRAREVDRQAVPRGQRRRRAGPGRRAGQGLRGRDHARHRLRHRLLHGRPASCPTWSSPTWSSARARPSTSRSARRRARRSATSAGTSGCARPSPISMRCPSSTTSTSAAATVRRVNRRDLGEVLERITVVDNKAGILGGIKLWDAHHIGVEGRTQ